jgi:subtilisin family serine protease
MRRLFALLLVLFLVSTTRIHASEIEVEVTETRSNSVASAQPDVLAEAAANTTLTSYFGNTVRTSYVSQPAATIVQLGVAQLLFGSGKGVVAIIDTGVDPSHPALAGALVAGYDFTRNSPIVSELQDLDPLSRAALTQSTVAFLDTYSAKLNQSTVAFLDRNTVQLLGGRLPAEFGHGTMVAGLVHLVAPSAKIMPLKAFNGDGTSKLSDVVNAVYYAVDHGATIINMSFSMRTDSPELAAAMEYAASRKVICVASGGNMGRPVELYPAGDENVIGVGSTNNLDIRSSFSNYDVSSVKTAAPGEALITTYPGGHYAAAWGTSFSSALVSGAVAVMRQSRPSASISDIRGALDHGYRIDQEMGDARLDIVRSVRYLTHK